MNNHAILLVLLCVLTYGCSSRSPVPSAPVPSPSGKYLAITSVNQDKPNPQRDLCVIIEITDTSGKLLYRQITGASDRMRWSIAWDGDDKLILDSSDIGTYTIQRQSDDTWTDDFPKPFVPLP